MPTSLLPRRRRLTGTAIAVGATSSLALALSVGASLSGYTTSITNSANTAASTAIAVTESSAGSTSCNSYDGTATCSSINKFGGIGTPMVPGGLQTVVVSFKNVGTTPIAATSTMKGGTCTAVSTNVTGGSTPTTPNTTPGNLCSVMELRVYTGSTAVPANQIFSGTLSQFQTAAATSLPALAVDASQAYTFVTSLPAGATNAVSGQQVSQPIAWTFNQ